MKKTYFTTQHLILGFIVLLSSCTSLPKIGTLESVKRGFEGIGFVVNDQKAPQLEIEADGLVQMAFFSAYRNQKEVLVALYKFDNMNNLIKAAPMINFPCQTLMYPSCEGGAEEKSAIRFYGVNVPPAEMSSIFREYMDFFKYEGMEREDESTF